VTAALTGSAAQAGAGAIVVTSKTWLWYLTRSTGLIALILLTATMALGLLGGVRWQRPGWPRFVTSGLHRNLSALACAVVVVHIATTLAEGFVPIVNRLAQAVAETRSMARTIRFAHVPPDEWDDAFREPWLDLLHRSGSAVVDADSGQVQAVRAELRELANQLAVGELHDDLWPVYGALLINLRNVLDALDAVVEAQPVQVASPALL